VSSSVSLAALRARRWGLFGLGGLDFLRVGFQESGAVFEGVGLVDGEVGADLVLQAQLPGVCLGGVQFPEAMVGHGQGRSLARTFHARGWGNRRAARWDPIVVLVALGCGQFFHHFLGSSTATLQSAKLPALFTTHAVVEIHGKSGRPVRRFGVLSSGGGGPSLGHLGHLGR